MIVFEVATASSELPSGYGASLLQAVVALLVVSLLAFVVLRWSARRGLGIAPGGRIRVLERVPLDGRRALFVVRAGSKVLLLAAGEGGAPSLVAELDPAEYPESMEPARASFAALLAERFRGSPATEPPRET